MAAQHQNQTTHVNNNSVSVNHSVNHTVNHSEAEDGTSASCEAYPVFYSVLLAYSIMALILYILLQRRVKQTSGCCGLPIPINLVYENKDRWVYAAVFGAVSGTFVQLVFSGDIVNPQSFIGSILQGFYLFLIMLIFPLSFFALIASVHGRIQVITHIIGFIYVATELTHLALLSRDCLQVASNITSRIERTNAYVYIYGNVGPIIFCNVLTGIYFLIRGAQAFISILIGKPLVYQHDVRHHLGYVKRLFIKKFISESSSSCVSCKPLKKLVKYIKPFMYKRDPYFKYPVRVLCITGVVVVGLLTMTVDMLTFFVIIVRIIDEITVDYEVDDINVVKILIYVAYWCAVVIPIISYVVTIISFLQSMKAYRVHCKRIWKRDDSFMPKKKEKPPTVLLRSTLYIGWQIAMVIWAWLLYVILLVLVAITTIIVVLALWYVSAIREWVVRRAILIGSATITGMIFTFAQRMLFRCLFAKGKTLIVNNSRLFHVYTYFLLFYNALVGIGAAIRRVVTSAVISMFFLSRLDRSLLIRGFDDMDEGYMTYLSAVRVDAAHNNPVMNVFVYFLLQRVTSHRYISITDRFVIQKQYQDSRIISVNRFTGNAYELKYLHGKARKMWYLAYTLIKNPGIAELRRRGIKNKKSASKLAIPVTSKNSHISDFAITNELAINNDAFEMETIVKEPARKNDDAFEVKVIVNELAVKNEDVIELEATIKEPTQAVKNDDGFEAEAVVKQLDEKNDNGFEVEIIVTEPVERNDGDFEVKENP